MRRWKHCWAVALVLIFPTLVFSGDDVNPADVDIDMVLPQDSTWAGSSLFYHFGVGQNGYMENTLAANALIVNKVDVGGWYALYQLRPGEVAKRFGANLAVNTDWRTRLSADYEHALPEFQFGADIFWLSWSSNIGSPTKASTIGAGLAKLSFYDSNGNLLLNQNALKLSFHQIFTEKVNAGFNYYFYSDPHGPPSNAQRFSDVQNAAQQNRVNIVQERPKLYQYDFSAEFWWNPVNSARFKFSYLQYFSAEDRPPENPINVPEIGYTRLLGSNWSLEGFVNFAMQSGMSTATTFGLQVGYIY